MCADYHLVSRLKSSHTIFEELQKTHEKQGLHAQMVLIKKAMEIHCRHGTPMLKTANKIDTLYNWIVNIGPIKNEKLRTVFLIMSLSSNFESIQSV